MDAWKKFSRARNQLYDYKVKVRQMHAGISPNHRTPQLIQLMEMVENLVDECATGFEAGHIVAMQIDHYEALPLPGFEDLDRELKNPPWNRED